MKAINSLTSACKYCRHYQPEGRRGGLCQQLNAPVKACWKACPLAIPAFAPSWESLEDVWSLPVVQPAVSATANINTNMKSLTTASMEENVDSLLSAKTNQAVIA
ncbi:MAG: hypothetical protein F6K62_08470 [Sphaerospermopsis sp. SIO1G2]|nr:hypothetical protein [Sphaerospermopsis sp. SIO1G1]NET70971.1 hypothetical protein [Sphaerospermopsis sp. SIO1G2]